MKQWMVARDRGNEIARELRLKKATALVNADNQQQFDRALAELARTPQAPARGRLEELFGQVHRRKEIQTAVALLDLAWRIPKDSRLEDDVVLMIRRCYFDAPNYGWRMCIRDELRDRQVHPFPNVRRVVQLVREVDPVDEAEIAEIRDLERGYPDLRLSIARRVIVHNQVEHLDAVITYLSATQELDSVEVDEQKAGQRLFHQLATRFEKGPAALAIVYPRYLDSYDQHATRGYLMLALAEYQDAIVAQLVHEHEDNKESRQAIEHVLSQIVAKGGRQATAALVQIVCDAPVSDVDHTCRVLLKGLTTLAGKADSKIGASGVRADMARLLPGLELRDLPAVNGLVDAFEALQWGKATLGALIDGVLQGTATQSDLEHLRRLARPASRRLIEFAEEGGRDPIERVRALDALGRLKMAATDELAARLWAVFLAEPDLKIRIGVLHTLAGLELNPGDDARDELYRLLRHGPKALAQEIRAVWNQIFPAVDLTTGNSGGGKA